MITRIGIIGMGLMGGSMAWALKRAFPDLCVVGMDVDLPTMAWANTQGLVTEWADSHVAFRGCEWVIVATPIPTIAHHLTTLNAIQGATYILSDISSVKSPVINGCQGITWRYPMVWMHPMAGKEVGGIQHADERLLSNRPMLIMGEDRVALGRVSDWVSNIPMRVVQMGLDEHDKVVGIASHWPYIMAMLTVKVAQKMGGAGLDAVVSSGFYDTTRVAASSAAWGADVITANHTLLQASIQALKQELADLETQLDPEQPIATLIQWLEKGRDYRNRLFAPPI